MFTGLLGELEHLKTNMRLIDEKFASVIGECVFFPLKKNQREKNLKNFGLTLCSA